MILLKNCRSVLIGVENEKRCWENDLKNILKKFVTRNSIGDCMVCGFNEIIKVQTGKGFFDEYVADYDCASRQIGHIEQYLLI